MTPITTDKSTTSAYARWRARLSERFGKDRSRSARSGGGVDLASVMVGVTILGVVAAMGIAIVDALFSQR